MDKTIEIHINTYKEARFTAIQLFAHNGNDSNIYSLTRTEWENGTPLYVNTVWDDKFIITK